MIDVPEEYQGVVLEKVSRRKGELTHMSNTGTGLVLARGALPEWFRPPLRAPDRSLPTQGGLQPTRR